VKKNGTGSRAAKFTVGIDNSDQKKITRKSVETTNQKGQLKTNSQENTRG
jgi:hypothetical protein